MHAVCVDQCHQVKDTIDLDGARRSYFGNLFPLNASGIVPMGPSAEDLGLLTPPNRGPAAAAGGVFYTRRAS